MNLRLLFLCVCILVLSSCSSRYYMKRGNVIYETGRFYKASSKYEKSYDKAKNKDSQVSAAIRAGDRKSVV